MNGPPNPQPDFYKSEYEGLRREIELTLNEARALERYAVIATSAVWAWLATNGTSEAYRWFWFIPIVVTALGVLRSKALEKEFGLFAEYLESVEERNKTPGWQTFLAKPENANRTHGISRTATVFWTALLIATILVGVYGACKGARSSKKDPAVVTLTCK